MHISSAITSQKVNTIMSSPPIWIFFCVISTLITASSSQCIVGDLLEFVDEPCGFSELIVSQTDVTQSLFSSSVRSTYLENEDNPEADTFTNVGNLDESDFLFDDGYFYFKLIYDSSTTIVWRQTSWLTTSTITGYSPISVPSQSGASSCGIFKGLGLSNYYNNGVGFYSFLDGNADENCWWNSVGTIELYNGVGIPSFNGATATSSALYVYAPMEADPCLTLDCDDSDECTTDTCDSALGCLYDDVVCDDGDSCTTDSCDSSLGCVYEEIDCGSDFVCVGGECVSDCTTFAMDEFLTDCSVGFIANVDDIGVLQSDVESLEARASVDESRLVEVEANINTRIDGVDTRIDGVDTRIDTVDEFIAAMHIVLEQYDATTEGSAANVFQEEHDMNGDEDFVYKYLSPENKDALIIFLLVLNMFTMGAGCFACMKSRGKYKQYESIRNYDTSDVDENQQLQS